MQTLAIEWGKKRASAPAVDRVNTAPPAAIPGEFAGLGARVLVVEDNAVNQKVAMMLLTKLGIRVDVAGHGREALDMLRMLPYDLVFMDCQMPEMNGYEATQAIRRLDGPTATVPIIAMTADVVTGSRERCAEAGMDDFVGKPVQVEALTRALRTWLNPAAALARKAEARHQ